MTGLLSRYRPEDLATPEAFLRASLPFLALEAGARVIEVNPDRTPLTPRATLVIAEIAGVALPRLA